MCTRDPGHPPPHHLGGGEGAGGVTAPTPAESVVRTWQRMEEEEGGGQALCPCYSGKYQEVNLFIYTQLCRLSLIRFCKEDRKYEIMILT